MQYTLRQIPPVVDRALRRRAHAEGKSLNQVALEALARGAGVQPHAIKLRDLSGIAGSWREDSEFDRVLAEQDRVDEEMWR